MRKFLQELIVPLVVLAGSLLYWISLSGAPSISKRFPSYIIVFVGALALVIVAKAAVEAKRQRSQKKTTVQPFPEALNDWWQTWHRRLIWIGVSALYYLAFTKLGFSLANFLFLVTALFTAGFARPEDSLLTTTLKILGVAFSMSATLYWLAIIMEFNVPRGPFGF